MTPLAGVVGSKVYEQRVAIIDLTTNALTVISPADMYVYEYDWTPDGQAWVATAAHGSGDANWYVARLYCIDAHSGEMREIYAPKLQIAGPRVSPDGKSVAFIEGLMSDEGPTGGEIFRSAHLRRQCVQRNTENRVFSVVGRVDCAGPNYIRREHRRTIGIRQRRCLGRIGTRTVEGRRVHRHEPFAQRLDLPGRNSSHHGAAISDCTA